MPGRRRRAGLAGGGRAGGGGGWHRGARGGRGCGVVWGVLRGGGRGAPVCPGRPPPRRRGPPRRAPPAAEADARTPRWKPSVKPVIESGSRLIVGPEARSRQLEQVPIRIA